MLIVGVDQAAVENDLIHGRLACRRCGERLQPWGHARRRELRSRAGRSWRRPRRGICAGCGVTHVLLADEGLARRRDCVADIGDALAAKAAGAGHRRIAAHLGVPPTTVRGWLRRFAEMAEAIRSHFTQWAAAFDPVPGVIGPSGSAFADAVAAIGAAVAAAIRRLGPRPTWSVASVLSGGALLSNTSWPWAGPG